MDYQKEYIAKNPDLHESDVSQKVAFIEKLLPKISTKIDSIIDIACGSGKILIEISKKIGSGKNVGVDISKEMINIARKNDTDNRIQWLNEDLYKIEDSKYNLVLAIDILEHVEDDLVLLQKIRTIGEFIILKVPIEKNILNSFIKVASLGFIDEHKYTENKYGHIHYYSESDIKDLIERVGLQIVSKNYEKLPQRTKFFWEVLRIIFLSIWHISKRFYLQFNGGFMVLLLKS